MATIVWSTPGNLGNQQQGTPIPTINLTAISITGGTLTYSVIAGQLPTGLNLSTTGQLTGTPVDNQSYKFVVRATRTLPNNIVVLDQTFSMTIVGHPPVIAPTITLPDQYDVVNFSYQVIATDIDPQSTLQYRLVQGHLPESLTLSSTGLISGPIIIQTPANYVFTVAVSDGTYSVNQTLSLNIINRANGTIVAPIIINRESNIGTFRVDDQFSYKVIGSLDGKTNTKGLTYSIVSGSLPLGLTLRTDSGWIDGFLSASLYSPNNKITYTFAVQATNSGVSGIAKTFTVTINTIIDNDQGRSWNVDSDLGSIMLGDVSKFDINPRTSAIVTFRLKQSAGTTGLPPNLILTPSGTIVGRVGFFDVLSTPTSPVGVYNFDAEMLNQYNAVIATKNFTIRTLYQEPYDNIYLSAFPRTTQRSLVAEILNDERIVSQQQIYRSEDPNFGVVANFKILFLAGLKPTAADHYIAAMVQNHQRKVAYIKSFGRAVAKDIVTNLPIYEVIYGVLEDTDQLAPEVIRLRNPNIPELKANNTRINASYNGIVSADQESIRRVYPNSFDNMRQVLRNNLDFATKESLPEWMTTLQDDGVTIGYSNVVPLVYVQPGLGAKVLNNIVATKELFDIVPFDIDGLIWECVNVEESSINFVGYAAVAQIPELRLNQAVNVGTLKPVVVSGGAPPYTYSVSPALPIGLEFNAATGTISNAAAVAAPVVTYTVTAVDTNKERVSATFTLTVAAASRGTTFINSSFENGLLLQNGDIYTTDGWEIYARRVRLNGLDKILGYPTPNDNNLPSIVDTKLAPNYDNAITTGTSFSVKYAKDAPPNSGQTSLRMISAGRVIAGYGIVHGPYAVSTNNVALVAGDAIEFWWKAEGGADAYDVLAYLLNTSNGATIELLNATGTSGSDTTPWTKVVKTIAAGQAGDYRFVFVSGTWDASGGKTLGASLYIDNIGVVKAAPPVTTTTPIPQIVVTPIIQTKTIRANNITSKYLAFPRTGISEYGKKHN
jgi:hypothetical protein